MLMISLPVGGTITRIACGSTTRRMTCSRVMPEGCGGLGLALVDGEDSGPHDLGHVGAFVERQREQRAGERLIRMFVSSDQKCGPNGTPSETALMNWLMVNQKMICTSSGVPRKNQTYSQATLDTTGFGDSRMTAATMPRTMPIAIDRIVSLIVIQTPRTMIVAEQVLAERSASSGSCS